MSELDGAAVAAVAALDDDLRRRLYSYVRQARRPIARDEAAAAAGISRKLAAFHLDKLVDTGLLTFRFDTLGGPKVGRKPKLYEPSPAEIRVQLPPRRHDLLADILADAVLTPEPSPGEAALRVARSRGEQAGADERARLRPGRLGTERALTVASTLVAEYGFEPSRDAPTCVRLRNCPFHPLAAKAPELVCGINQAFLSGVLAGLEAPSVEAVLAPGAAECCVELHQSPR